MRRGLGFTIAWAGATIVAVVVAAAAVGSVRSQVTGTPTALGAPTAVAIPAENPPTAGSFAEQDPTTTVALADSIASESTSTTMSPDSSSSTTSQPPEATTTTTAPNSSSATTTAPPPASETKSYTTPAGTVRILISGESVAFAGATPDSGWTVELEKAGPPEVEVHFERNDDEQDEVEFHAKFEDGELVVSIS